MKVEQRLWTAQRGWSNEAAGLADAQLVLVFGAAAALEDAALMARLRHWYPQAYLAGCSTAGEIHGRAVGDDGLSATALKLERGSVRGVGVDIADAQDSARAAAAIAAALRGPALRHVLVFSDGLLPNGSTLAAALREWLPPEVCATGGLAGDGARFERTLVCDDGAVRSGRIVGIGLYGEALRIGHGSLGGWDGFGPRRRVTRASGNVLRELDGRPALELYKTYLGPQADELPGAALLYPLLLERGDGEGLVRTVLGIDESDGSMTFAGDLPEGSTVRLMKANFDRLVDGAGGAAQAAAAGLEGAPVDFALLISCVGRKLVLKQRVEDEVERVAERLPSAALAGFYSYGELCPRGELRGCELHNQTMTVTTLAER